MLLYAKENINPTLFPDNTSQVWKLSDQQIYHTINSNFVTIEWEYESETELFHVLQLCTLLRSLNSDLFILLDCPFLPYGRQDKPVSNNSTFALSVFLPLLNGHINYLQTLDSHTDLDQYQDSVSFICESVYPKDQINHAIKCFKPTVICYPDKGAADRYHVSGIQTIILDKIRDPSTGSIIELVVVLGDKTSINSSDRILIIDDICDGGATFIKAKELLCDHFGKKPVFGLYTTHGIYSKGTSILYDSFQSIYNRKDILCLS